MLINAEPIFSEYQFFKLFACVSALNGNVIIDNHQLERDLFPISRNPEYHELFVDIAKTEDKIFPEHSHVNLSVAFQTAYTFGLCICLAQNELKTIISLSMDEAKEMLEYFEKSYVEKMFSLYEALKENKNNLSRKKVLESNKI